MNNYTIPLDDYEVAPQPRRSANQSKLQSKNKNVGKLVQTPKDKIHTRDMLEYLRPPQIAIETRLKLRRT